MYPYLITFINGTQGWTLFQSGRTPDVWRKIQTGAEIRLDDSRPVHSARADDMLRAVVNPAHVLHVVGFPRVP